MTFEQKNTLKKQNTNAYYLAKNLIKRGLYTKYDFAYIYPRWGEENADLKLSGTLDFDGESSYELKDIVYEIKYQPNSTDNENFKKSLSQLLFADINTEHSQLVDVANIANNKYKMPKTIINFDSHSDLCIRPRNILKIAEIGDWANFVLSLDGVDKFVWVFPYNAILSSPDAYYSYFKFYPYGKNDDLIGENNDYTTAKYDYSKPLIQKFYFDIDKKELTPVIGYKKPRGKNIKIIDFIVCSQNSIPDFKNEDVFLSIDGDYFNNSGISTKKIVSLHPFNINKSFSEFAKTLEKANIYPKFLNCTISPEYTTYEKYGEIYGFFKYLLEISNKKDSISKYVLKLGDNFTKDDVASESAF